jgi:uncharacterized membrane protein
MDSNTFLITLAVFLFWSLGTFLGKFLTEDQPRKLWQELIDYLPTILIYCLALFELRVSSAMSLKVLSGLIIPLGMVGFYFLLKRAEISLRKPLTALYPGLTAIIVICLLQQVLILGSF